MPLRICRCLIVYSSSLPIVAVRKPTPYKHNHQFLFSMSTQTISTKRADQTTPKGFSSSAAASRTLLCYSRLIGLGRSCRVSSPSSSFVRLSVASLVRGSAARSSGTFVSIKADPDHKNLSTTMRVAASLESVASEERMPHSEGAFAGSTATSVSQAPSSLNGNGSLPVFEDFLRDTKSGQMIDKLVVVGHRGCGKNKTLGEGEVLESRPSIRENTITSFNLAFTNGADFVEFDVQVTKDGHPIIFHDDYIIVEDKVPRKIGELKLDEFLAIGPQKNSKDGRTLYRVARDGSVGLWTATTEDSLCTLQEAFARVDQSVGFNIEVKFDDVLETSDEELRRVTFPILDIVKQHANGRKMYYSSFHPDAVHLLRSEQSAYPVFFLTDGGVALYNDPRRNSIQAAIEVCKKSHLQGIVTEVKAILNEPGLVSLVKRADLWLFTYGDVNNIAEAVHKQKVFGVDGVIVDHVLEMATVARNLENNATWKNDSKILNKNGRLFPKPVESPHTHRVSVA